MNKIVFSTFCWNLLNYFEVKYWGFSEFIKGISLGYTINQKKVKYFSKAILFVLPFVY